MLDGKSIRWFLSGLGAAAAIAVPLIFQAGSWKASTNDEVNNLTVQVKQINEHLQYSDAQRAIETDTIQKEGRQIQWLIDHSRDARYAPDGLAKPESLKRRPLHVAEKRGIAAIPILEE